MTDRTHPDSGRIITSGDVIAELQDRIAELESKLAAQPTPSGDVRDSARPCTCSPADNPPKVCAQQYALTECQAADAARWRETGEEDPQEGQEVLAAIYPYGNKANRLLIVHAVYVDGQWLCPAERTSLHAPGYWMPAPALPDGD